MLEQSRIWTCRHDPIMVLLVNMVIKHKKTKIKEDMGSEDSFK